jgi:peptidoglycan glycosyltransferase
MDISQNVRKLARLFVLLFLALTVGFVYWQVGVAQAVTANPHNSRACMKGNEPQRGRIFDRNGTLLAYATPSPTGCGVVMHYTDPSLAGLIGYYVNAAESSGIEKQFDPYLSGQMGSTLLGNTVNGLLHRPPIGDDIYLTIDDRIQKIADSHFDDTNPTAQAQTFPTDRGSIIVSNPRTGEILAMVSRPEYDPNLLAQQLSQGQFSYFNQISTGLEQPLLERPIQGLYTPGSIFKTPTLLGALDSGATTLNQQFDGQHAFGPVTLGGVVVGADQVGSNLAPYTISVPVNTQYGYTHSDNVIFAQVGVSMGTQSWQDYMKRFYVGQDIPFDLPVAQSSVVPAGQTLDTGLLSNDAFGQGDDQVTPLQMALIDNTVADGGQMMRPSVVEKIVDPTTKAVVYQDPDQSLGQPVSTNTAMEVLQSMYSVVQCGSGSLAGVQTNTSPWDIVGKTGSAQLGALNGNIHPHGWMITAAPYSVNNPNQLPALTIVAMKENSGDGGYAVGPMITNIYNDIFNQGLVQVTQPPAANPNVYCCQSGMLQIGCPGVRQNVFYTGTGADAIATFPGQQQ